MASLKESEVSCDFFKDYKEYTNSWSESPDCFHHWSAVSILSSIVARKLWIKFPWGVVYPNHYIIVVSDSAIGRKSSAVELGENLLDRAIGLLSKNGLAGGALTTVSGHITREAFFRLVSQDGLDGINATLEDDPICRPVLLFASELEVMLTKDAQSNGFIGVLTDVYTCPNHKQYITKTSGQDEIYKAYVNLLGACTPSWIIDNINTSIFNAGFVGRCMFIYDPGGTLKDPWEEKTKTQEVLEEKIIETLRRKSFMSGEMTFTPKAQEFIKTWYLGREVPNLKEQNDGGFFGREHVHTIKLAMNYSIGRRDTKVITLEDAEDAQKEVEIVKRKARRIFSRVVFAGEDENRKFVEGILRDEGKVTRTELMRKVTNRMKGEELSEYLNDLIIAGLVTTIKVKEEGKKGRGVTRFKWEGNIYD